MKKINNETVKYIFKSFIAGFLIGIGGLAYFLTGNKFFGAFVFNVALFFIFLFETSLFTGTVGYLYELPKKKALKIPLTFLLNFLGAFFFAGLVAGIIKEQKPDVITMIANTRVMTSDNALHFILKGVLCGIVIHLAIEGYAKSDNYLFKFASIILPILVFVLIGAEHSVANSFYYGLCIFNGVFNWNMIYSIIVLFFANGVGGIFMRFLIQVGVGTPTKK